VLVLPSVNREIRLSHFESNSTLHTRSKQELRAFRVVDHHVLKFGLQSLFVNNVEVDMGLSSDLNSHIAFSVVDHAPHILDNLVLHPLASLIIDFKESYRV
jgi:hypothetical protein